MDTWEEDGGLEIIECTNSALRREQQQATTTNQNGTVWKAPRNGRVKLNIDAALKKDGLVGLGVIIRDSVGDILLSPRKNVKGSMSVLQAEVTAVQYGLKLAFEAGFRLLEVERTASTLCTSCKQKWRRNQLPKWWWMTLLLLLIAFMLVISLTFIEVVTRWPMPWPRPLSPLRSLYGLKNAPQLFYLLSKQTSVSFEWNIYCFPVKKKKIKERIGSDFELLVSHKLR